MLLSPKQVCERLQISRQTLYRWTADPRLHFPQPVRIPNGSVRWVEYQLITWAIWMQKCDEATQKGIDQSLIPPPDFSAELPTSEQAAMMDCQQRLDGLAKPRAPQPRQQEATSDDMPEPSASEATCIDR